jgi:dTMP kinase
VKGRPRLPRRRAVDYVCGVFVTFEGLDGSGKTTQLTLLAGRLREEGRDVVVTREPGGTDLGEKVRDLVLHGGHVAPWAEAALYAASRAQHVEEVIRPALARGATVLCDRYVDSSVAYQGVARGLGLDRVLDINLAVVGGLLPDVTFLLLLDPAVAAGRLHRAHDRLERESIDFHARADAGYRELAARFPERMVVLDGSLPADTVAERVHGALRDGSRAA